MLNLVIKFCFDRELMIQLELFNFAGCFMGGYLRRMLRFASLGQEQGSLRPDGKEWGEGHGEARAWLLAGLTIRKIHYLNSSIFCKKRHHNYYF